MVDKNSRVMLLLNLIVENHIPIGLANSEHEATQEARLVTHADIKISPTENISIFISSNSKTSNIVVTFPTCTINLEVLTNTFINKFQEYVANFVDNELEKYINEAQNKINTHT